MNRKEKEELKRIIESAHRLGVEVDEAEALQWLTAISAQDQFDIHIDEKAGVFGNTISMLDFTDKDLAHFRKIGKLVEFDDIPGKVETALALSGSAAQSKVQTYPGDADYFERVNIIAPTREEACVILSQIMREKALTAEKGATYHLIEVKFGSYPQEVIRNEKVQAQGSPISWTPQDIHNGYIACEMADGKSIRITWEAVQNDPGWCKLDWIVADTVRRQLVNASNMLDVTWEAPNGEITPLDGYLDSYFQEIYLDAESIPIFSKLVKHVSPDALNHYVSQLENEVFKYYKKSPNYGKAAKRLYNIFRLTGRYADAAYLRELFDEPATMLYQIGALVRTVEESQQSGSVIDKNTILEQTDKLIIGVTQCLEGEKETEMVRLLLNFRRLVAQEIVSGAISPAANAAREELANLVNNFFYEKLSGMTSIHQYLQELVKKE